MCPGSFGASAHPEQERFGYFPIVVILLAAFSLRLLCILFLTGSIDPEGAEYARIAENLLAGKGYEGIATPGKQLFFPPLFPFLIATTSFLTHSTELAGRLVSLAMGTMLVLPAYLIARRLYSRRTAYIAATLVALQPSLASYSATVYSETTYLTLLLAGVYWMLQTLRLRTVRAFLFTGGFFGLAYLTRPEAAIFPFLALGLTLVYVFLTDRQKLGQAALRSICLPAAFLVLAAPYILWLHVETGQWRIEGKSPLNYATGRQILAGVNFQEATHGVDTDLTERGVWIQSNLSTIRSADFTTREVGRYLRRKSKEVLKYLRDEITGAPSHGPLFVLAMLGLFRKPWHRELAANQLFIFMVLAVSSAALFFIYYLESRFLLVFLPFLIVWASEGIVALARWASATMRLMRGGIFHRRRIELVLVASIVGAVTLVGLRGTSGAYDENENRPVKTAGEWLNAYAPGPKIVMATRTILPFHATATFAPFPYADSEVAIRYLDKRSVNFIVLEEQDLVRPYLKDWMDSGVPSARAKLIYSDKTPAIGRLRIYEWNPIEAAGVDNSAKASSAPSFQEHADR